MKVYVDELPKRCLECGFCCKDDLGYWCQGRESVGGFFIADEMCIKERLMSCPLQSLADHDKQVRKEVCEELKEEIRKWCKENFDYKKLPNELGCWVAVNREEFFKLLDQIQGDDKC